MKKRKHTKHRKAMKMNPRRKAALFNAAFSDSSKLLDAGQISASEHR